MDEIKKDSRFSHILKDPRFKKLPKKHVKVKIDKRFQSMFNEKKFQIKYNADKRGRKAKVGNQEDLKRYYALSDSDEDDEESNEKDKSDEESDEKHKSDDESDEKDKSDEESESDSDKKEENEKNSSEDVIQVSKKDREALTPEVKSKLKDMRIDYARGEGIVFSESSSDEESSDSEGADLFEFDHGWGELDKDADHTDEVTNRLAVCNMNWDRIEATDLMVLFNSFLPPGGLIHSVTVYPSDFGLERMKEEEEKGPMELTESLPKVEEEELNLIQMEKLRVYQLNRLKYYYAVVVCDSPATADALYKECDGLEYESSSSKLDLRFIPDDTTFEQEPRETCTSLPNLATYKPKLFMTSALTKAKCDLTWDENDPNREEIVKSTHSGNVDEDHLKKYLACSSSEDSEEEEQGLEEKKTNTDNMNDIDKYKALLSEIENKEKNSKKNEVNLEVTWNLKLENKASEIVKEVEKEKDKKTPFQQYLEKRKEKKKKKKEAKLAQMEEGNKNSEDSAFSDDDIPSDIDMNDPYFREEFESFKNKKSSKTKKSKKEEVEDEESKRTKAELELLLLDNEPENLKHFSLKKIEENEKASKKKGKGKKRKMEEANDFKDDFKIDVNDERFSALYTSHHFNIDPADPQFKPTKATKQLIEEKLKRREMEDNNDLAEKKQSQPSNNKQQSKNAELMSLVKNIKKNTSGIYKKARHK